MLKNVSRWCGPLVALMLASGVNVVTAQSASVWRPATENELKSLLPARAAVEKEHIETEMRTASGITDGQGKFVAGVVLITAGYSADGKYSHYFVTQVPLRIGSFDLAPGEYVFGWQREQDSLNVHFYEAASGALKGSVQALRLPGSTRVELFKVWPPGSKSALQIGRFGIPYQLRK